MAAENGHVVGDCPNDIECVEEEESGKDPKSYFNINDVFNALKNQQVADNIASLPPDVQRRIKALKRLQFQVMLIINYHYESILINNFIGYRT